MQCRCIGTNFGIWAVHFCSHHWLVLQWGLSQNYAMMRGLMQPMNEQKRGGLQVQLQGSELSKASTNHAIKPDHPWIVAVDYWIHCGWLTLTLIGFWKNYVDGYQFSVLQTIWNWNLIASWWLVSGVCHFWNLRLVSSRPFKAWPQVCVNWKNVFSNIYSMFASCDSCEKLWVHQKGAIVLQQLQQGHSWFVSPGPRAPVVDTASLWIAQNHNSRMLAS